MRINISEVTFNREFSPKNFGSRTFFKTLGGSYYQCNKEKIFFSSPILLIESVQILNNKNILTSKVIRVVYLIKN